MRKIFLTLLSLFLLCGGGLWAQSNELLDTVLDSKELTSSLAARLLIQSAGLGGEGISDTAAFKLLEAEDPGWKKIEAEKPVTISRYCSALFALFDLEGGIMHRTFPGPRYAFREAQYLKWIDPDQDPGEPLTGREALNLLSQAMEKGGTE